jgi:hypothetical protein
MYVSTSRNGRSRRIHTLATIATYGDWMRFVIASLLCAASCTSTGKALGAVGTAGVLGGLALYENGSCPGQMSGGLAARESRPGCTSDPTESAIGSMAVAVGGFYLFMFLLEEIHHAGDER